MFSLFLIERTAYTPFFQNTTAVATQSLSLSLLCLFSYALLMMITVVKRLVLLTIGDFDDSIVVE